MAFNKNFKGGARDYGRPREDRGSFGDKPRGGGFGPKRFGDKPRGSFSGDRGPVEMFSATCANCNKACEVPFRPSGDRPVYCKDCFGTMKGADERGPREDRAPRGDRPQFGDRNARPAFTAPRPGNDASAQKIEELSKKVDALAVSLDYAIKLFKGDAPVKKVEVAADKKEVVAEKNAAKPVPAAPSKETRLAKKAAPKKAVKGKGKK